MFFSKLLLACSITLIAAAVTAALPSNALEAIESQKDLSFITSIVKRDPVLVKLYTEANNVTIIAATDPDFEGYTINDYPYNDIGLTRAALQFFIQDGRYSLDDFTPTPKYVPSKLTNSSFVNLSRGNQPSKLVEIDGKKIAYLGSGYPSPVSEGDIKFKGGILHKISKQIPLVFEFNQFPLYPSIDYYAISNLSSYGVLDKLSRTRDVTLFAVSNAAWDKIINEKICFASLKSIPDILKYYVVVGNVYYGDSFTGRSVKTLSGESVYLAGYPSDNFTVNGVRVVASDVTTVNGVIQILESPIFPPGDEPTVS